MNSFSLKDKHILITGASNGIGRQCAISISEMDAKVTLIARDEERLKDTVKEMKGNFHKTISLNITDFSQIKDTISKITKINGKIDGFIHAAGIEITKPLQLTDYDTINKQMNVNTYAGIEFVRHLSRKKNSNEKASFVFIASIRGFLGMAGLLGYSISKGALLAAVKSLAVELSNRKIRVNAISPGQVNDTEMTKAMIEQLPDSSIEKNKSEHLLGWINKEDVANACIFLLSDASQKITGDNLIIDGGYSAK